MDSLDTKTYSEITHAIRVSATPFFIEEESSPEKSHYLWAYQIRIENLSPHEVHLKRRHWEILDAHGYKQLIEGEGIIGQQPTLKPGDALEYTSSAPLSTPSGVMHGYYVMVNNTGEEMKSQSLPFLLIVLTKQESLIDIRYCKILEILIDLYTQKNLKHKMILF